MAELHKIEVSLGDPSTFIGEWVEKKAQGSAPLPSKSKLEMKLSNIRSEKCCLERKRIVKMRKFSDFSDFYQ